MRIIIDGRHVALADLPHLLPTATTVEIWDCLTLGAVSAPLATRVRIWGCPSVTVAPLATDVDIWECPALGAATT